MLAGLWQDRQPPADAPDQASEFDAGLGERLPLRILLAEDNTTNQELAVRFLRRMGYGCDVVSNGREAVAAADRHAYDAVLMDVEMPEMDGLEAAREIGRALGPRRPRIIAMTANAMLGDRERCLAAGIDDYVAKPIRIGELQAALAAVGRQRHGGAAPAAEPPTVSTDAGLCDTPIDTLPIRDPTTFEEAREFLGAEAAEVIGGVITSFRRGTPEMLATMRDACVGGEPAGVRSAAHTLKGLSGTVGARRVQALCTRVEAAARAGSLAALTPVLDRLESEFRLADDALAQAAPAGAASEPSPKVAHG